MNEVAVIESARERVVGRPTDSAFGQQLIPCHPGVQASVLTRAPGLLHVSAAEGLQP